MKRMKKRPKNSKRNVFGVSLMSNVQRNGQPLPLPLQYALQYLRRTAIGNQGLFRKSGVKTRISRLRLLMETQPDDSEKIFTKDDDYSPYDIADLVKMYFRELPEPLMTQKLSQTFISIFSGKWHRLSNWLEQCPSGPGAQSSCLVKFNIIIIIKFRKYHLQTFRVSIGYVRFKHSSCFCLMKTVKSCRRYFTFSPTSPHAQLIIRCRRKIWPYALPHHCFIFKWTNQIKCWTSQQDNHLDHHVLHRWEGKTKNQHWTAQWVHIMLWRHLTRLYMRTSV